MSERRIGKLTWCDACELNADQELIKKIDSSVDGGEELLVVKETFGEIRELPDVIIVTTEKDNSGDETITIIPRSWMIELEELK